MKVAITADLHLKTKVENTERYNALINILNQLLLENINNLIIAGDLFEINSQNYSIFDELCKQKKYNQIAKETGIKSETIDKLLKNNPIH